MDCQVSLGQTASSHFLESPWMNYFFAHSKNWWVCLIVVCPCWPSVPWKRGRTKTATRHLYYAVFPLIYHFDVSFLCKLLDFSWNIGTGYCSFFFFLSDCMDIYYRRSCKDDQISHPLKPFFILKVPNTNWVSSCGWRRATALRKHQLNLELIQSSFIVVIFYSDVLNVGISERQRCTFRAACVFSLNSDENGG